MKERILEGYSKSFIEYIKQFGDIDVLYQDELEDLLPSRELVAEDEKQFRKFFLSDYVVKVLIRDRQVPIAEPLSYQFAADLLSGAKEPCCLSLSPEEPVYILVSDEKEIRDGVLKYKQEVVPMTFTKKQFLESTRKYSKQKTMKLEEQ